MNPLIPVLFALVGLAFLALLLCRTLELNRSVSLRRHRSTVAGLCDLINYAAVAADGVVIGKSGCLIAGWRYHAPDNASSTYEERNALAARLNHALAGMMGSGWCWHVDAIRRPAAGYPSPERSHFPDPVTEAIDQERRRFFGALGNLYETELVLTVTYQPPAKVVRRLAEWMYDDDRPKADAEQEAEDVLARFCRDVDALEDRLSSVFRLERLKARTEVEEDGEPVVYDDLLAHLQRCLTGLNHPIRLPRTPVLLDALLGGQDLWGDIVPQVGLHYVQCVSIDGFPSESYPGILTALSELSIGYRWNTRFLFLDRSAADSHLEKVRRKWDQLVVPFLAKILRYATRNLNRNAAAMAEEAHQAKAIVDSQEVVGGYYTANVVLMHEDRGALDEAARAVYRAIHNLGFSARIEAVNNLDAFFGTLPGHVEENERRPLLHSLNLAHLLPVAGVWTGQESCPCPFYPPNSPPLLHGVTSGDTPFRLNLHVGDVAAAFIAGSMGTGKSTLLATLGAQLRRYRNMSLFCFDKGMSMYTLCKAAGGQHYHVAGDDARLAFCPLQHLGTDTDRAWAVDWIEKIVNLNNENDPVTPKERNEIARSIESMHRNGHRTLSNFVLTVQVERIRETLREYTIEGSFGRVFDAEEDGLQGLGNYVCFEVEELMGLAPKYSLPILWYLFRRIERSLKGQPAAIIMDEAWLLLDHPLFREKVREWLKTKRKQNCAVVMATQSLTDIPESLLSVINQECLTKIFLPNANALQEDQAALYRRFGLNDRQIELLAGSRPKRDYYYTSPSGRRLFSLELGPLALAFVALSDKETVAEVQRLERAFGNGWVEEWLSRRELSLADYLPEESETNQEKVAA
ncbi:MAG: conjugal transfer protein TrbE [Verrucomicrobia bacterium]|nr:conjugal transfer protein TrbE [Verrucomicrobiota bacterium]